MLTDERYKELVALDSISLSIVLRHYAYEATSQQRARIKALIGSPKDLAVLFHENYERLAPSFGYETRLETQQFDADSPNGQLMVAVCEDVIEKLGL